MRRVRSALARGGDDRDRKTTNPSTYHLIEHRNLQELPPGITSVCVSEVEQRLAPLQLSSDFRQGPAKARHGLIDIDFRHRR